MAFMKKKPNATDLFNKGYIIVRPEELFRFVHLYETAEIDRDLLIRRIKACLPQEADITTLVASPDETFFSARTWNAKLVYMGSRDNRQAFEFWFTDPKSSSDFRTLLHMNMLQTAVEKAFLLSDPQAWTESARATAPARNFDVGGNNKNETTVFSIFEWRDLSPSSVMMKALEMGADTVLALYDGMQTELMNEQLRSSGIERRPLLALYANTPALPQVLQSQVASYTNPNTSDTIKPLCQNLLCPACGSPAAAGARFCIKCGSAL